MRYLFLLLGLAWQVTATAGSDVDAWLMKMNEAANSLDYDGVYVHVNDNHIDSLRIVHKIKEDGVYERLYALNGVPREVIRDPQRVWCFIPDKSMGVLGERPGKDSGFPGFMVSKIEELKDNYDLSVEGHDRIADRSATRISILPRDNLRYGYDLWADNETGLLLKTQLVDSKSTPVEQYTFVMLKLGDDIPEDALEPMTSKTELVWHQDKQPRRTKTLNESSWDVTPLPTGYKVVKMVQRWMPMEEGVIEQMVLSDGLGAVSVFIEPSGGGTGSPTLDRMGAVSAYSHNRDGWQITVIGEVPLDTVEVIGNSLVKRAGE